MRGAVRRERLLLQILHYLVVISAGVGISICIVFFVAGLPAQASSKGKTIIVQITGPKQPPGFFPAFITMHVNDTIVFINHATSKSAYSVVAVDGSFASPAISPGQSWQVTFTSPGTHEYREAANPLQMVGVFLVVDMNVALLPLPDPHIEATVLAVINAQQPLPETPVLPHLKSQVQIPVASAPPFFLLFLVTVFGISCVVLLIFLAIFYRRYRLQTVVGVEDENEPSFAAKLLEHLFVFFSQVRPFIGGAGQQFKTRLRTRLQKLFQKRQEDEEDEWEKKEKKKKSRYARRDEDEDF